VAAIAAAHDGTVAASNLPGGGADVVMTVPRGSKHLSPAASRDLAAPGLHERELTR
jgi:hypothetical protein